MNTKGNFQVGFVLLLIFFILAITAFAMIEPLKESLDINRGSVDLNCPGTPDHNATAYVEDSSFNRLVRRPTCFVTGLSMVWFVFAILFAGSAWVVQNWSKKI